MPTCCITFVGGEKRVAPLCCKVPALLHQFVFPILLQLTQGLDHVSQGGMVKSINDARVDKWIWRKYCGACHICLSRNARRPVKTVWACQDTSPDPSANTTLGPAVSVMSYPLTTHSCEQALEMGRHTHVCWLWIVTSPSQRHQPVVMLSQFKGPQGHVNCFDCSRLPHSTVQSSVSFASVMKCTN